MSDRDLLQDRSRDEKRFLREHFAAINADPAVIAAKEAHELTEARFTTEAFRSGVNISGYDCRMTIGTLALMRFAKCRMLGYGDDTGPITDHDTATAVFLMADEMRPEALQRVDDKDELTEAVDKFRKKLDCDRAYIEVCEWFRRISNAASADKKPTIITDGEDCTQEPTPDRFTWMAPDDSWADDVALFCKECPAMRDDYVLWELPLVRSIILKDAIRARISGKRRTAKRDESAIAILQATEAAGRRHMAEYERLRNSN